MPVTKSISENVSAQIENYRKDVLEFQAETKEQLKQLVAAINHASAGWEGSSYEAFKDSIVTASSNMFKALDGLDEAVDKLESLADDFKEIESIMGNF